MPALKHIHQYVRFSKARENHLRCVHPQCTSWTTKAAMDGKESLCNYCGRVFILNSYALKLKRPKCELCRLNKNKQYDVFLKPVTPESEREDKIEGLVQDILSKSE